MNTQTFPFELVTPCFSGSANPEAQAEIRAPAIRGQLRWWFRVLGGFTSLAPLRVAQQERLVFGSAVPGAKSASRLIVQVKAAEPDQLRILAARIPESAKASLDREHGYLLFPLRNSRRAFFAAPALPKFDLVVHWRGDDRLWEDVRTLVTVFGHLGSLGFRSRRAMGALAFQSEPPPLEPALGRFASSQSVLLKQLPANDANHAIAVLARWLKGWRNYGRTADLARTPQRSPGFKWARNDHDAGRNRNIAQTYRPALGLPIVQRFSSGGPPITWNCLQGGRDDLQGRFASPVLLRPYRAGAN
ncbi:MAG: type III-B CRISPR module RAMP protein Cmr1, partial [Candidatus Omnitrophica bacterium]|nr:type III-B CRISPR module RAMP protein Cmr1 [Candidatus Omnitrophota bacterium]